MITLLPVHMIHLYAWVFLPYHIKFWQCICMYSVFNQEIHRCFTASIHQRYEKKKPAGHLPYKTLMKLQRAKFDLNFHAREKLGEKESEFCGVRGVFANYPAVSRAGWSRWCSPAAHQAPRWTFCLDKCTWPCMYRRGLKLSRTVGTYMSR
jgi:hypothetical protein